MPDTQQMFSNTHYTWAHPWQIFCTQSAHSSHISPVSPQTQIQNSQASLSPYHGNQRAEGGESSFEIRFINIYKSNDQLENMQ